MEKIYKQLSEIQAELKAPKGQYNTFGKYSYRKADDILEAVKPILAKKGMSILLSDRVIELSNTEKTSKTNTIQGEGQKVMKVKGEDSLVVSPSFDKSVDSYNSEPTVVIEAQATIFNEEGQSISVTAQAGVEKAGGMQLPQAYGSASSYARKYAMSGLFAIDDERDADDSNTHNKKSAAPQSKPQIKPQSKGSSNSGLPVLNKEHKNWAPAITYLKGSGTIEALKKKYSISAESEAELLKASKSK